MTAFCRRALGTDLLKASSGPVAGEGDGAQSGSECSGQMEGRLLFDILQASGGDSADGDVMLQ